MQSIGENWTKGGLHNPGVKAENADIKLRSIYTRDFAVRFFIAYSY